MTGTRVKQRGGGDFLYIQRQGGRKGLHDRARLESVRDGAIAQGRHFALIMVVGIVSWQVDQCQNLACMHVDDNACSPLGLFLVQSLLLRREGNKLQNQKTRVEGKRGL